MRAAAGFLLLAATFSGCLSDTGDLRLFAAVDAHRDAALEIGKQWHPQAALIEVTALEPRPDRVDLSPLSGRADPRPGDGRVQAARYTFHTNPGHADGLYQEITLTASGETDVTKTGFFDARAALFLPLGEWNVGAEEAAAIALTDDAVEEALAEDPLLVRTTLTHYRGLPTSWFFTVERTPSERVSVAVDAVNGTLFPAEVLAGLGLPAPEQGSFTGSVTALDPQQTNGLELAQTGHPSIRFLLRSQGPASGAEVRLHVQAPDGNTSTSSWFPGPAQPNPTFTDEIGRPLPGSWTITVELARGATFDYTLEWCARGYSLGSTDGGCPNS